MTISRVVNTRSEDDPGDVALLALLQPVFVETELAAVIIDETLQLICATRAADTLLTKSSTLRGKPVRQFHDQHWARVVLGVIPHMRADELEHLERTTWIRSVAGESTSGSMLIDAISAPCGRQFFLVQLPSPDQLRRSAQAADSEGLFRQMGVDVAETAAFVFDGDLRLRLAIGTALRAQGYDQDALIGQSVRDAFPPAADLMHRIYRDALVGRTWDYEFTNKGSGRQFRLCARPIMGIDGNVIAGMSTSEDITAERARKPAGALAKNMGHFGVCVFHQDAGWVFDEEVCNLWGVDNAHRPLAIVEQLVVSDDQAAVAAAWTEIFTHGGRSTLRYRIHHGETGELRHIESTFQAVVDSAGRLLMALGGQVDITDAITAQEIAQHLRAEVETEGDLLLEQVREAVATTHSGLNDLLQNITNLAASALGEGAILRILTPEGLIEQDMFAHRDEDGRQRLQDALSQSAEHFDPADHLAVYPEVTGLGMTLTSIESPGALSAIRTLFGERTDTPARHFIVTPVRHDEAVLGLLAVYRTDPDEPYESGDEVPVQVLADRVGFAVADNRSRQVQDAENSQKRSVAHRLERLMVEQRDLLEQLASSETKERSMMANAIHDDPLQLIVAAVMRLDNLRQLSTPTTTDDEYDIEFDNAIGLLETSVEQLRKLSIALVTPDFGRGLGAALRDLAEGIFVGTSTTVEMLGMRHVQLGPEVTVAAYRILRESLLNARKHAAAQHVTICLEQDDTSVNACIADDGAGSTTLDAGPGHFGLATMRARAEAEDAYLDITSTPGSGTVVNLTLPIEALAGR